MTHSVKYYIYKSLLIDRNQVHLDHSSISCQHGNVSLIRNRKKQKYSHQHSHYQTIFRALQFIWEIQNEGVVLIFLLNKFHKFKTVNNTDPYTAGIPH